MKLESNGIEIHESLKQGFEKIYGYTSDAKFMLVAEVVGQTDPVSALVSDPVKKLLITLCNEELAISELMRRMGLSHKPTFRKNVESCLNNR